MRTLFPSVMLAICGMSSHPGFALPQENANGTSAGPSSGGDQFLDGIGETSLVSRFPLSGTARDWSRNSHNGVLRGAGAAFVPDPRFGTVLDLPGTGGAFLELPRAVLEGVDSFSFSGWIWVDGTADQPILDLGSAPGQGLSLSTQGLRLAAGGKEEKAALSLPAGRWVHVALVVDPAQRVLMCYLDGVPVGDPAGKDLDLARLIQPVPGASGRLLIGRQGAEEGTTLKGRLHDVRFYRVALTPEQVAAIHRNGTPGASQRHRGQPPAPPTRKPTLVTSGWLTRLERVADIKVSTSVGNLPRLPLLVPGTYPKGAAGPKVRVVWPSPTDNRQVLQPGSYTLTGKVPGTTLTARALVTVTAAAQDAAPARTLEAFPLDRVVLREAPDGQESLFVQDRDKFVRTLARTHPDDFLFVFREAFGRRQPEGAKALGVWDSQDTKLRGHATGHYLSALAQAYAGCGRDKELQAVLLQKMNYTVDALYDLAQASGKPATPGGPFNADPAQVPAGPGRSGYDSNLSAGAIRTDVWNWGRGFVSAYPPDQFIMLEKGATYGGQDNQIWAPYYTLHKILAGLLDCHEVTGNPKALTIAQDMGAWVYARLRILPAATRTSMWDRYIAGEYGGMNEVLGRLFRITRNPDFLACAKLFDNVTVFFGNAGHEHGLGRNVDVFRGKHANQLLPQILGALETYRVTAEASYWHVADNFWDICLHQYSYTIGGVAGAANPNNAECFTAQPSTLWENGFSDGGQNETCATYNLLKLDRQLFMYQPDAKYMDHYERGMYNHILASVAKDDPGNTYHVPLNPGAQKQFSNGEMDGFTCCNGTALESHTKLQDSIYFRSADNRSLYVNLFVPSTLDWAERKVAVTQETAFPYRDTTRLTFRGGGTFSLNLRVPGWAEKGCFIKVNGRTESVAAKPGTYVRLKRAWKTGDVVEVRIPFTFHLDPVMDQPNIASLCYGPIVLAAQESGPRKDFRKVTLKATDLGRTIQGDAKTLHFRLGDVDFKPFFESYGNYSVYLDVTLD